MQELSEVFFRDAEIAFGSVATKHGQKPLLVYPNACGIFAFEERQGEVYVWMVQQYRLGSDSLSWELPAGKVKQSEALLDCAKRELAEEAGQAAGRWNELLRYYPAIGISTEELVIYEATDLSEAPSNPDDDEEFTIKPFTVNELGDMIRRGEIIDAKTIISYHSWLKDSRLRLPSC